MAPSTQADEQLMDAVGRGDAIAGAELFRRYRQPVWAFFRRRVADRSRAEDLVQDVFVAVLKNARRYRPDAPFRSYLFGVAFRVLASDRRRARRHAGEPLPPSTATPGTDDDCVLQVQQALSQLSDADRDIVMLREFEELSYAEIAAVLHVPLNTVRSRLFRARLDLKQRLMS